MSVDNGRITSAQVRRELMRNDARVARRRAFTGIVVIVATALLLGALASKYLFVLADIRTDGMSPALNSGDIALCARRDTPLWQADVRRGALALVRYSEAGLDRQTVRRLIALGGDVVSVDGEGRVILNDQPLDEPYATYRGEDDWTGEETVPGGALENPFAEVQPQAQAAPTETVAGVDDMDYPLTVPEGAAFVLCDNRDNTLDSRSSRFGLVSVADIEALVQATIWPVYRAGLTCDTAAVE